MRSGRVGTLTALVAIELLAVSALHRLGRLPWLTVDWRHLSTWLTSSGSEDALAATLRVVALVCAYWLLLSTILYVAARLVDVPTAVRAVEWATLPALRRLTDRALAVALVSSTVTGGAGVAGASPAAPPEANPVVSPSDELTRPPWVQPPPPPGLEVPCAQTLTADESRSALPPGATPPPSVASPPVLVTSTPGLVLPPNPQSSTPPPSGVPGEDGAAVRTITTDPAEPARGPAPEVHEVVQGDNLWHIAASTLERRHRRGEPTKGEIARYWSAVVAANRHRLRSGDPNLVFPGEQVVLPPSHEHR